MKRIGISLLFLILSYGLSYGLSFDVAKVGGGDDPTSIAVNESFTIEFYANFIEGDSVRLSWSTPFRFYGTDGVTTLTAAGTFVSDASFNSYFDFGFNPSNNASTLESWDGDLTDNAGGLTGDQFNYTGIIMNPPWLPNSGTLHMFDIQFAGIAGDATTYGTFCVDSGDFVDNSFDWLLDSLPNKPTFGPVCWNVGSGGPPVNMTIPDMESPSCASACVPVTVTNFTDVAEAYLNIGYDSSCMSYDSVSVGNLAGANVSENGSTISISWVDTLTGPLTLGDGETLFEICFSDLSPDACPISFVPNNSLFDESYNPIALETTDGSLWCVCDTPMVPYIYGPDSVEANTSFTICWETGDMATFELQDSTDTGEWTTIYNDTGVCYSLSNTAGTYYYRVRACDDCGCSDWSEILTVVVTEPCDPPVITCPGAAIDTTVCTGSEICINVPITGADSVWTDAGQWGNDQLCFTPTGSESYYFTVIAINGCGEDTCHVTVNTTLVNPVEITCPASTIDVAICGADSICVSLPIAGADDISVTGPAEWDNDLLCFMADTSGIYTFNIEASNICGPMYCDVSVAVTVDNIPDMPAGCFGPDTVYTNTDYDICWGTVVGAAYYELEEESADTTLSMENGLNICRTFNHADTGTYAYRVRACNDCGCSDMTADFPVVVVEPECYPPAITCPTDPLDTIFCDAGTLCIDLPIGLADSVWTSMGTWADDQLCITVDAGDYYHVDVMAFNDCGQDSCGVTIHVDMPDPPSITCLFDPVDVSMCGGGTVCISLGIFNATQIDIDPPTASWANDTLCFDADTTGLYTFHIEASNYCGFDECYVSVIFVNEGPPDTPTDLFAPDSAFENEDYYICWAPVANVDYYVIAEYDSLSLKSLDTLMDSCMMYNNPLGEYSYNVMAYNSCGPSDWSQEVIVPVVTPTTCDTVQIVCPDAPLSVDLCDPDTVIVPLDIYHADDVMIDGAVWSNGEMMFFADMDTTYYFIVYASNNCSSESCFVSIDVNIAGTPTACFEVSPESGTAPLEVSFSNCSVCDDECLYLWDFGDSVQSAEMEPTHTYANVGCYTVTLTVSNLCGHYDQMVMTDAVCVTEIYQPQWISVYCADPTLNGDPLLPGDMITAYDPEGVLCGSAEVKTDGSYGFMEIYRDDPTTTADEGAQPGDMISFRINDVEVTTDPVIYWTENGDYFELCTFSGERCLTFDLNEGWNWISWNVEYSDDIMQFVQDFESCIDVVLSFDRGGQTFVPGLYQFATLTDVDYYRGFMFKMNCAAEFEICGPEIDNSEAIQVYTGWNLISYWPNEELMVEDALTSILNDALVVLGYDGEGLTWAPDFIDFNTLTHMNPQFGYWLKSSDDAVLAYPGFTPIVTPAKTTMASYKVAPSRSWMSVYGAGISLDGQPIAADATIDIRTEEGVLCGSGTLNRGVMKFTPVYGYDKADEAAVNYPQQNATLEVYVNGVRAYPDISWDANSVVRLEALSSSKDGHTDNVRPNTYALYQNYPNPFNPETTIKFNLPVAGHVELSVFNMLGQNIRTLADETFSSGEHEVVWDGASDDGRQMASGVYFYRLKSADFVDTRKMNLMK
jgi:PKD repeat protein